MLFNPKLRDLLKNCHPEYFNDEQSLELFDFLKSHPELKITERLSKELRHLDEYVKIITLQYEELYESLDADDLEQQAIQLKSRLVNRYVKTQKQSLVSQMQDETDDKKLRKLIQAADKLNELIK